MGSMVQAPPQYGVNESRQYQDLVYEIDEYECDDELNAEDKEAAANDDANHFKTIFSFEKMVETMNSVSRLERNMGQVEVIDRVIHENKDLKELVER